METLKNSTRQLTLDELIYLQEDSLANPTAPQGNEKERKTNATCGRRCLELFESVHPVGSWERMFAGLLIGTEDWFSRRCALTWKLTGTPFNRLYFQLAPSTLPTDATEFGLLLTPTTTERSEHPDQMRARAEAKGYRNGTKYNSLKSQILYGGLLPTPTSVQRDHPERVERLKATGAKTMMSRAAGENRPNSVLDAVMFYGILPTPTTRDYKGARSEEALKAANRTETNSLPDTFAQSGKTSQLNPLFVEEMMGFPKNWTVSPFQNGEENQSKHTETQ